ncbi:pyridoxal phosphate-dependent decarboxylase family protein [Arenibacterium halophilum]|uniref:Cytochrome D ubiquinol oxidase subunit I n=1 Tax=Arenibacterium halophilum TaxID=2583821 RepID=A0ABY2XAK7_9RHOB|nr:pyridoxal-dependent decarboxylase [Arenibacterium halophilum]TMV12772.1 cytochrome D ubiquinol oxidase subunit I [Arenibacterium halophilum]
MSISPDDPDLTLDPSDWDALRARAHTMLDAALEEMQRKPGGPVWQEPPEALKALFDRDLPVEGLGPDVVSQDMQALLPHGVGNTHPRFFGWVHGSGTPAGVVAEIAAAAMNANLGGRDHGAIYVEKQVMRWCRELFGFPEGSSGLIVSGTSMATIIALKAARDRALGFASRTEGVGAARLVGYTSTQTHACVARAFDMLGLGSDALRRVPVNAAYEIDTTALADAIARDRAEGLTPFAIIGTAGSVDLGAIDDLAALARIAAREDLWFHVDGAFGALAVLSEQLRPRLAGMERADSLAFDFHKWMHVNYDAGFVLIRSEEAHRRAFSDRPGYLQGATRGLAAGNPWPVEYGPELSRGFRALKVWAQIAEFGTARFGALIDRNCAQAAYLADAVRADPALELMAPVALNICCFRYLAPEAMAAEQDHLTEELVIALHLRGTAAPSTTTINGQKAIRVNITNHRTGFADLDLFLEEVRAVAADLIAGMGRNTG